MLGRVESDAHCDRSSSRGSRRQPSRGVSPFRPMPSPSGEAGFDAEISRVSAGRAKSLAPARGEAPRRRRPQELCCSFAFGGSFASEVDILLYRRRESTPSGRCDALQLEPAHCRLAASPPLLRCCGRALNAVPAPRSQVCGCAGARAAARRARASRRGRTWAGGDAIVCDPPQARSASHLPASAVAARSAGGGSTRGI